MDNVVLREKRREEIIRAAMSVFARNGFDRSRMETIAAEAGVGKGTIYEYFSSKKQLFEEMINYNIDQYKEDILKITVEGQSLYEKLYNLCLFHADFLSQHLDILGFTGHRGMILSCSMKKRLLKVQREILDILQEMLEQAITRGEIRQDIDREAAVLCIAGVIVQLAGKRIFVDNINAGDIDPEPLLDILLKGLT